MRKCAVLTSRTSQQASINDRALLQCNTLPWAAAEHKTFPRSQGKLDEASEFMQKGLEIDNRVLRPEHPKLGGSLNNQAQCLAAQVRV